MPDKHAMLRQLTLDRNPPRTRRPVALWSMAAASVVAVALLVGTGALVDDEPSPGSAPAAASPPGNADRQDPSTLTETAVAPDTQVLNASGYITARRMATISAEITGRITEVLVEEGMAVEQGQVVARLDDALAQVDLRLAEARVVAAGAALQGIEADLNEARRVLRRIRQLAHQNNASEAALTRAEAGVESLSAELGRSRAVRDIARLEVTRRAEIIEDHLVRAPFSGVVVEKTAQPGEIVSPISAGGGFTRTGICTVVDMSSLEIEVDVNEAFIGRVFAGQLVEATLDAYPDWRIPAAVIAIVPTANRQKATVRVRIGIEQNDRRILPDMGVKVAFLRE
ncbi:MAG: efflux RND transporter periplasmic adaptor subunit [Sphingomonadales bacterium]